MRMFLAALAAASLGGALHASQARAADAPEGYYEERESYRPVERRVEIEEPSWRRVEIEEPLVEERVVIRRRHVVEDGPRWRRVHLRRDRFDGPVYGVREGRRGRLVDEDYGEGW